MSYNRTNKQTDKQRLQLYIYRYVFRAVETQKFFYVMLFLTKVFHALCNLQYEYIYIYLFILYRFQIIMFHLNT